MTWRDPRMRGLGRLGKRRIGVGLALAGLAILSGCLAWLGRPNWPVRVVIPATRDDSFVGFSGDGRSLSVLGTGGEVWYDAASGRPQPTGERLPLVPPRYARDRRSFVEADAGGSGVIWRDAATSAVRGRFPTPGFHPWHVTWAEQDRVIRAVLGQKGPPELTSGGALDGTTWTIDHARAEIKEVATWDVATGATTRRPVSGKFDIVVAYSPDGRFLADYQLNRSLVRIYDLLADRAVGPPIPIGDETSLYVGMFHESAPIQFTPDGHLAIGQPGGRVELWHPGNPSPTRVIQAHPGGYQVHETVISPDGRTLASVAFDSRPSWPAWFWPIVSRVLPTWLPDDRSELAITDPATGRVLARSARSSAPCFSPDGRTIATREPDGSFAIRAVPRPATR